MSQNSRSERLNQVGCATAPPVKNGCISLPPIDLPGLLAKAEEYKLIAPRPRYWGHLQLVAEEEPIPGEPGANGNKTRLPQLPMRLFRHLLKEALGRTDQWKRGVRTAFFNDKGDIELPAKTLATRTRMSVEAVYFAVESLRQTGLIEAHQPGFQQPYLFRIRFDRLVQLCWELDVREKKIRRRGRRKKGQKGLTRVNKPWPSRMDRLFRDVHGDRRRLPIVDIVRVLDDQLLPGELGAHGNNTRVANQVVDLMEYLLNELHRRVSAGQSFNGEFVIYRDSIADEAGLPNIRSADRVLGVLRDKGVIRTFERNNQFWVAVRVKKILQIEAQVRTRTGIKNVEKFVPTGSEHCTPLYKSAVSPDAVLAAASDSIDPRAYLSPRIVQRMPAGAAIERPSSREKIVIIPDGDYAAIIKIIDEQCWDEHLQPGDRPKIQRLVRCWVRHRRYPMTAPVLREIRRELSNTDLFSRLQVKRSSNLLEFLSRWPGYLRTYWRYRDQDRSELKVRDTVYPDRFIHIPPEEILGGYGVNGRLTVVQDTLDGYRQAGRYEARDWLSAALKKAEDDPVACDEISGIIGVEINPDFDAVMAEAKANAKAAGRQAFGFDAIDVYLDRAEARSAPGYRSLQVRASELVFTELQRTFRDQCQPPGHWEVRIENNDPSPRWPDGRPVFAPGTAFWRPVHTSLSCHLSVFNREHTSHPDLRFVPEAPDPNDTGISELCVASLLGLEERFSTLAKRHLRALLDDPLHYASCYQKWDRQWLEASGVNDEDHIATMRKANRLITRSRAWMAIMAIHERVTDRAKALAGRKGDPEEERARMNVELAESPLMSTEETACAA